MGANNCNFIYRKPKSEKENIKDFYQSDMRLTFALLDFLKFGGWDYRNTVCEPCKGKNAIVDVLSTYFKEITAFDLFDDDNPVDFMAHKPEGKYDLLIMNPPFSSKNEFIDHALEVAYDVFVLYPGLASNYNVTQSLIDRKEYYGKISCYPKLNLTEDLENGMSKAGGTQIFEWMWFTNDSSKWNTDEDWLERPKKQWSVDVRKYYEKVKDFLDKR